MAVPILLFFLMFPHFRFENAVMAQDSMTPGTITSGASITTTTLIPTTFLTATTTPSAPSAHATFLFPVGNPTYNNIDTVELLYQSIWESVNLTLFCETDVDPIKWCWYNVDLIAENGSYLLAPIQMKMHIHKFPVPCHMVLYDAKNAADAVNGGSFIMLSTPGVASTFTLPTGAPGVPPATGAGNTAASKGGTAVGSGNAVSTGASTATGAGRASITSTGTITQANSASRTSALRTSGQPTSTDGASSSTADESSSSGGLSTPTKAGIGVGVPLAFIALAIGVLLLLRRRRGDGNSSRNGSVATGRPAPGFAQRDMSQRRSIGGTIIPGPPITPANSGVAAGAIAVPSEPIPSNRTSADWKRFFKGAETRNSYSQM